MPVLQSIIRPPTAEQKARSGIFAQLSASAPGHLRHKLGKKPNAAERVGVARKHPGLTNCATETIWAWVQQPTRMTAPEASVGSFVRDGLAVRELVKMSGSAPDHKRHIGSAQTWLNAFCLFRRLEDRIGLPESEDERDAYFALLSTLFAAGNALLTKLKKDDRLLHDATGVSYDGFEGCVRILEDAIQHHQRSLSEKDGTALVNRLFEPDGKAAA